MREIVLDTETTGLSPNAGHRIVEIGCIELVNHLPTGDVYHAYVNPEREMPDDAFRIHGLSDAFLADQPVFAAVAGDFLEFIQEDSLVIHNADFDMGFVNAELTRIGFQAIPMARAVDTVRLARSKFPGAQASLDALCRRFGIDNSARTKHGALLDAELLAEVYLELIGGRQPGFGLAQRVAEKPGSPVEIERKHRAPRPHAPSADELSAHRAFVARLTESIWDS